MWARFAIVRSGPNASLVQSSRLKVARRLRAGNGKALGADFSFFRAVRYLTMTRSL